MEALIVVDVQNEFSPQGRRPVPNHGAALAAIRELVGQARREKRPIAWVRHHNKPEESPAFVPGSWGAELSPGLGPQAGAGPEALFEKDVFGAFTGTGLEDWLRSLGARGPGRRVLRPYVRLHHGAGGPGPRLRRAHRSRGDRGPRSRE
jgi:nicotinamidase-related amidase